MGDAAAAAAMGARPRSRGALRRPDRRCLVAVRSEEQLLFLVLPLLGWIAWRFQQRGAAPAALIVSVIVTAAAAHDTGPFAGESLLSQMILLQSFNASVAFTSLLFASAVAERQELVAREQLTPAASSTNGNTASRRRCSAACSRIGSRRRSGSRSRRGTSRRRRDVYVGGDWYDIIPLGEGRLGLVIGDVAGHGVNAAATMGQIRMALRAYALDELAPDQALGRLNRLMRELQPGAMATVLYGHLDPATRDFVFANAGHPPPLLIRGPHDARLHRRRALAAGRRHAERRVPRRRRCGSIRVRRSCCTPTVWSSGARMSIDERLAAAAAGGRAKRPTTSNQCAITSCPRCSTRGPPTTSRSSRFGRSRSSARRLRLDGPALPGDGFVDSPFRRSLAHARTVSAGKWRSR